MKGDLEIKLSTYLGMNSYELVLYRSRNEQVKH